MKRYIKSSIEQSNNSRSVNSSTDITAASKLWMGKYKSAKDNKMHRVYFEFDTSDFEEATQEFEDIIPEPYSYARLLGTAPYEVLLQKDGFEKIEASDTSSTISTNVPEAQMIDDLEYFYKVYPEAIEPILIRNGANPDNDNWLDGCNISQAYNEAVAYFESKYDNDDEYSELDTGVGSRLGWSNYIQSGTYDVPDRPLNPLDSHSSPLEIIDDDDLWDVVDDEEFEFSGVQDVGYDDDGNIIVVFNHAINEDMIELLAEELLAAFRQYGYPVHDWHTNGSNVYILTP